MTMGVPSSGVVRRPSSPVGQTIAAAFDAHAQRLKAFALAAARDDAAADELVEGTFVRFAREVRAGRIPDDIGVWLYRECAALVIIRGRRRSKGTRNKPSVAYLPVATAARGPLAGHDDEGRLRGALAELPTDARTALLLAAAGVDLAEIAAVIGRTTDATSIYICRARIRLRELVAPPPDAGR